MSSEEKQLDAAEFVIGTLPSGEKAAFEADLAVDADLQADVTYWERTLGTLGSIVSPVTPSPDVWDRIKSSLPEQGANVVSIETVLPSDGNTRSATPANDNQLAALKRSRGRWRLGAIAATVAAIGFGGLIANERVGFLPSDVLPGQLAGKEYIAVVQADAENPALIVKVNGLTGGVTVRQVGVKRPDDKSLELWYIPVGTNNVVSVGLVGEGEIDLKDLPTNKGDTLAISLEPKGGSPTGVATGPVIYSGKLIEDVDAAE